MSWSSDSDSARTSLDGFKFRSSKYATDQPWYMPDGLIEFNFSRNRAPFKREYRVSGWSEVALKGDLAAFQNLVKTYEAEQVVFVPNYDGKVALHYAAAGGHTNVCQYLSEIGNFDINRKDWDAGEAALHLAILEGRFETAVWLLEHGADPNLKNNMGWTPLHYVAVHGPATLIPILLLKGAQINALAECGTALQVAAREGHVEMVEALLENKADPNVTSFDRCSPLIASIRAQSIECFKLLLKAGADYNYRGSKGMTPLAHAAVEGSAELIQSLLDVGADPNATNDLEMKPIEEAALRDRRWAVKMLFPLTTPIRDVLEWSIGELFKIVNSLDRWRTRMRTGDMFHLRLKVEGDKCFKKNDYLGAVALYTEALAYYSLDMELLSNRSLCWIKLNEGGLALEDAEACNELRHEWSEAYYREGCAFMLLKKYPLAAFQFRFGSQCDIRNSELWDALWKAEKCEAEFREEYPEELQNRAIVLTRMKELQPRRSKRTKLVKVYV